VKQFSRFVLVGVLNTVLGYCVIFACMYVAHWSAEVSNMTGYAVGLTVSYLLNRTYTFNSTQRRHTEMLRFLAGFGACYGANMLALMVLIHQFGVHEGVSQVIAGAVYVMASYLVNKHFVFAAPRTRSPGV
jgi:putative flippase GtrA